MERVFTNGLGGGSTSWDRDDYESMVLMLIRDATDYEESYLSRDREYNMKYYYGAYPLAPGEEESPQYSSTSNPEEETNRSDYVSTDVRDTVLAIMPSLMRIFGSVENVVNFTSRTEQTDAIAKQQTDMVSYEFWVENQAFNVLYGVFKEALSTKVAVVQLETDITYEVGVKEFYGITPEQYQFLLGEYPDTEVEDFEQLPDGTVACAIKYQISKPARKAHHIPPEEFRINRDAKSVQTARLVGWERIETISALVKKGIPYDMLLDHVGASPTIMTDEKFLRNPGIVDSSMTWDGVVFGDWYVWVDSDGDGVDELHNIWTIGQGYTFVRDVIVDDHNFAAFHTDPRAHTFVGDCPADLVIEIQRIKSNMQRANLDNLAEATNPKTVINELLTNIEDALNDEVGAIIRTRGDPNGAVAFSRVPYVGSEIIENISYLDAAKADRTGVTKASQGLDPKALQSTALTGIDAIIQGAQERIELVARCLAETGLVRLYQIWLRAICRAPNRMKTGKLRGAYHEWDPSLFDETLSVEVNPTMGKGSDMTRLMALQKIEQTQILTMEKFGPDNPLCGPIEFRNTQVDMMSLANVKDTTRYFKNITPEIMQQIAAAPKEPDPAAVIAKAEVEKIRAKTAEAIANTNMKNAELDEKVRKANMDDDFRRDQLNVNAWLDILELANDNAEQEMARAQEYNQPAAE